MNKALIEFLISLFQDEIDAILESLEHNQKNQIYEIFSLIMNINLDQNELTRLARMYAGNRSQVVIDNVNRLRTNLILQPAANQRVQESIRFSPAFTLQIYLNLLQACMLSYLTSALQSLEAVNNLTHNIDSLQEKHNKLTQDILQYKTAINQLGQLLESTKVEKNKLEQEKVTLQDQLAQNIQKAEQGAKAEAERQRLQQKLLFLQRQYEALNLPLELEKELSEKQNELATVLDEIKRILLHEAELKKQQSILKSKQETLSVGHEQIANLATQLEEEKTKSNQQEIEIGLINQKIFQATDEEVKNLQEQLLTLMSSIRITNNNIKRLEADLRMQESNRQALLTVNNNLTEVEKKLFRLAENKSMQEQKASKLKEDINIIENRLQPNAKSIESPVKPAPIRKSMPTSPSPSQNQQPAAQVPSSNPNRVLPKIPASISAKNTPTVDSKSTNKSNKITIEQLLDSLNIDEIKTALESGQFEINTCDRDGRNLLHHTCLSNSWNRHQLAELLLEHGINKDTIDTSGRKPVHYAEDYGDMRLKNIIMSHVATSGANQPKLSIGSAKAPSIPRNTAPNVTTQQQIQFDKYKQGLLENVQQIRHDIEQRGSKIIEQMQELRLKGELAAYDNAGQASPTLASLCLAADGDVLARLRQCLEDALESTQGFNALYCSQYIGLLLNQVLLHPTAQFRCLAPMTISEGYQSAETLQPSVKALLTSRLNCIPLHINQNHWVVLLVHKVGQIYQINYINPYGYKIDRDLREKLQNIFGIRLKIVETTTALQHSADVVNCGAYLVEICRILKDFTQVNLVEGEILDKKIHELKQNMNIIDARVRHVEIANQALQGILLQLRASDSRNRTSRAFSP